MTTDPKPSKPPCQFYFSDAAGLNRKAGELLTELRDIGRSPDLNWFIYLPKEPQGWDSCLGKIFSKKEDAAGFLFFYILKNTATVDAYDSKSRGAQFLCLAIEIDALPHFNCPTKKERWKEAKKYYGFTFSSKTSKNWAKRAVIAMMRDFSDPSHLARLVDEYMASSHRARTMRPANVAKRFELTTSTVDGLFSHQQITVTGVHSPVGPTEDGYILHPVLKTAVSANPTKPETDDEDWGDINQEVKKFEHPSTNLLHFWYPLPEAVSAASHHTPKTLQLNRTGSAHSSLEKVTSILIPNICAESSGVILRAEGQQPTKVYQVKARYGDPINKQTELVFNEVTPETKQANLGIYRSQEISGTDRCPIHGLVALWGPVGGDPEAAVRKAMQNSRFAITLDFVGRKSKEADQVSQEKPAA